MLWSERTALTFLARSYSSLPDFSSFSVRPMSEPAVWGHIYSSMRTHIQHYEDNRAVWAFVHPARTHHVHERTALAHSQHTLYQGISVDDMESACGGKRKMNLSNDPDVRWSELLCYFNHTQVFDQVRWSRPMCVCVCVCVCVCMPTLYICTHVYTQTFKRSMYIYITRVYITHTHAYARAHTHTDSLTHTHTHTTHMCIYLFISPPTYLPHLCMNRYTHAHDALTYSHSSKGKKKERKTGLLSGYFSFLSFFICLYLEWYGLLTTVTARRCW